MNSRLDTLQAAILLPKFKALAEYEVDEATARRSVQSFVRKLSDNGLLA